MTPPVMTPIQIALEYLLLGVFFLARVIFLLQGLAFGAATAAALLTAAGAPPDWLANAAIFTAALSITLFVAGVLLPIARRCEHPSPETAAPGPFWPVLFGLTLVLVAGLSVFAVSRLPALWSEILGRLDGAIVWEDLARPAPNAGIVLLPILAAILVPALVTLAALASILLPLALLVLLPGRRPRFTAILTMAVVCQTALVTASWLAAHALGGLAASAVTMMRDSRDLEVIEVADQITQATGVVEGTASALVVPALGMLAWLIVLRPWRTEPDAPPLSAGM